MYTFEEDILHFIFIAFKGLKRKKEDIDLVFHSVMVGNMLKNIGCSENIVYTGYLHDIIEDTKYSYEDLKERYGKELADNVQKLSENTKILNYKERKEEFINRLKTYNNNLILVELADKIQNLVSDYSLFLSLGKLSKASINVGNCKNVILPWIFATILFSLSIKSLSISTFKTL